jgi:hypothetical protein
MAATTVERVVRRLEAAWAEFLDSYAGLADAQLVAPGATGAWSIKDVMAHVTIWEEEALKHLPLILAGGRPPRYADVYGGIDAFNRQMVESRRGLSLAAVREQQAATHRRLVELVRSLPADQLTAAPRARRRLRLDTYGHYPLHTEVIRAWRRERLQA